MQRNFSIALSATAVVAVLGITGCSHSDSPTSSSVAPSTSSSISSPIAAPPATLLPAPEALTDVLNRLADPNVAGIDRVTLIEGATPQTAATLDKFSNALRDNGYLPMTFTANNIAWSDKNPSDVM